MPTDDHRKELEIAWAAGFLDGEGCFTFVKARWKNAASTSRYVSVSACQLKKEPLLKLQKVLGGVIKESHTPKGKKLYRWHIQNAEEVRNAIKVLLPYLSNKQEDAQIVYKFALLINPKRKGRNFDSVEIAIREQLIKEMEILRNKN